MTTLDVDSKVYKVQKALLLKASPWFPKALSGRFKERQDEVLRFPDTKAEVVEYFLYWLLYNKSPFPTDLSIKDMTGLQHKATRLWIFADKHFIHNLRYTVMLHLHASVEEWGMDNYVRTNAFKDSPPKSLLRQFVVHDLASCLLVSNEDYAATMLNELDHTPGLMVEVTRALVRLSRVQISNEEVRREVWWDWAAEHLLRSAT